MKFLLIGHSVEDHIYVEDKEYVRPGGIYYSAAAFINIISAEDEIYLCSLVDENSYHLFKDVYDGINKTYLKWIKNIPRINLIIHPEKEREEHYHNLASSLKIDEIEFDIFDGVLINMITGFEINPGDLSYIRNNFRGKIYFDVHSLSRELNNELKRVFRPIKNFALWAENIDLLQANESEILTLSSKTSEAQIVKDILSFGPGAVILTKDTNGAMSYCKTENGIDSFYAQPVKIKEKNKVGCGDIFGAVFFYTYIKTKNFEKALTSANKAGGFAASMSNLSELRNLKKYVFE
jgi:hypothetical protein